MSSVAAETTVTALRTDSGEYRLEAEPIAGEPGNVWYLMLHIYNKDTSVERRAYRIGGIWREAWQYYVDVHRGVCRHQSASPDVPDRAHHLGHHESLWHALQVAAQDIERLSGPQVWGVVFNTK